MSLSQTLASVQAVSPVMLDRAPSAARIVGDTISKALLDAERLAGETDLDIRWDSLMVEADFDRRFEALRFRVRVEAEPLPAEPATVLRALAVFLHESRKRRG